MNDFDTQVNRENTGNMKGRLQRKISSDALFLWGAEMDYPTAPCIRKALSEFALNGIYGFTNDDDIYRAAISAWMAKMRNYQIENDWIVATLGTTFALATAVRAFTEVGDGVIVQGPSYYRFDSAIMRCHRNVVTNPLLNVNGEYKIDFDDLERKTAEPKNKLMVLVNPHNPTGKVFTEEEMKKIAEMADRNHVIVFCDEIFGETAQPGHEVKPYIAFDKNGITSTSLGKIFNFTGVNHANLIIPNEEIREKYIAQRDEDHFGSVDPFFYNALLAAYSDEGAAWIKEMNEYNRKNVELIEKTLKDKMPLLAIAPFEGTYVAWMDCRKLGLSDEKLQSFFEDEAGVYADPGYEYGDTGKGFYRLNIATPRINIRNALDRLVAAYGKLFSA